MYYNTKLIPCQPLGLIGFFDDIELIGRVLGLELLSLDIFVVALGFEEYLLENTHMLAFGQYG